MGRKFKFLQNNFTSGQLSPLVSKRSDFDRYQNGAKTLTNMQVMTQGGVTARTGSKFIAETKDSSAASVLIPFKFSGTDAYMLEFGNLYMRVYKDSGLVLNADQSITGITQANPAVVTYSGADNFANGDQIFITEVVGMTEINDSKLYYTVANVDTGANTFELQDRDGNNVDSSSFTAYSSGGVINEVYEITTPYATADLANIDWTQSGDTITLTHPSYEIRDLVRTSDTSWALSTKDIENGPFLTENTTSTTLTPSGGSYAPGDSPTVTASATTGINDGDGFQTTDVGRVLRIYDGTNYAWGEITARSSTTVVTVLVKGTVDFPSTAQTKWALGVFSDTTGHPEKCTYYQQRLILTKGETVYGSETDNFISFTPGTDDDNAIEYTVAAGEVNDIEWVTGGSRRLRIGTNGGVQSLWGGSTNQALTPTNAVANIENTIKCKEVKPISNGNSTLFLQRTGKKMRELVYSFDVDALIAPDITVLSEDILGDKGDTTDEGIIRTAWQEEPWPIVWCVKDNGEVATATYDKDQGVIAWTNNVFGGASGVEVESVGVIPTDGQDRVWLIIKRTIDSTTRRYVEHLDLQFRNRSVNTCIFSDCHTQHTGDKPAATLTPGATSGTSVTFTAGSSVFASSDVGRFIESSGAKARIDTYNSGTEVVCEILSDFPSTAAIASGSWNLSVDTIDGLDYIEGETVKVLANGGEIADKTVSSGSISLGAQYNYIGIGLGYDKEVEISDIDFGGAIGTAFGSRSKVVDVYIDFFETVGGQIGYEASQLSDIVFREGDDNMGEGIAPFTGAKRTYPKGGWRDATKTLYKSTSPLPVTILSMVIKGDINE
jgi:hypothetical protein